MGPRAIPALVAGVGIGLIGSGVFVTDPVGGFPPGTSDEERSDDTGAAGSAPTREGGLHNICAIPIFAGIPVACLARRGRCRTEQGLPLGLLLGRIESRDGRQLPAFRLGFRRRVTFCRQGRDLPAHFDRIRVRMAHRSVASSPVFAGSSLKSPSPMKTEPLASSGLETQAIGRVRCAERAQNDGPNPLARLRGIDVRR